MSSPVKHFLDVLPRALRRARHFALVEGLSYQPRLARNRFRSGTQSDPCISSLTTLIMITTIPARLLQRHQPQITRDPKGGLGIEESAEVRKSRSFSSALFDSVWNHPWVCRGVWTLRAWRGERCLADVVFPANFVRMIHRCRLSEVSRFSCMKFPRRVWGLRLRRTEQELALSSLFMLSSAPLFKSKCERFGTDCLVLTE
jgi:hypothetical protein